jgi:hypothetical protein
MNRREGEMLVFAAERFMASMLARDRAAAFGRQSKISDGGVF